MEQVHEAMKDRAEDDNDNPAGTGPRRKKKKSSLPFEGELVVMITGRNVHVPTKARSVRGRNVLPERNVRSPIEI
jgi:hypothetical protein